MDDFTRVAGQLRNVLKDKRQKMQRVVIAGEGIAKREAPVKRGPLRRSITSRVERNGDRGVIGTNLAYARPVHDGSRPHIIKPKRAKALAWKGALHPVRSVRHPGNKANPFFERTARQLQRIAADEFGRDMFRGVR